MNVLIVMFDSLRPDFMGCYGNEVVRTPNFDAFSAESCVFANATAEFPITIPSRTAYITGNYTFTNRPWRSLSPEEVTLAQILQANGYRTAAICDSPFRTPTMERGFDEFHVLQGGKIMRPIVEFHTPDISHVKIPEGISRQDLRFYLDYVVNRDALMETEGMYFPDLLTREALKWLDGAGQEPFMLWLDYFDPHEPWEPPPPYDTMYTDGYKGKLVPMPHGPEIDWATPEDIKSIRAQYAGCVTQVDEQFGKLCDRLKDRGLWDETIVILISDHGEPLGEHGRMRKFEVPVYDDLARIVFMIRVPGTKPVRSNALAQNTDLLPTLLSLLGLKAEQPVQGVDLNPLMRGEAAQVRERAYTGAFQLRSSIRTPEWKFIDNRGEKPNELFNLIEDPAELRNLAPDNPRLAEDLHRELWLWGRQWAGIGCQCGDPWHGEDLSDMW